MPNLRFLNVRFNLDAPDEREIFEALAAYPPGARSQVIREALAARLEIEIAERKRRESHASVRKSKPWQADVKRGPKVSKVHSMPSVEKSQTVQEKSREKPNQEPSPESVTDAVSGKDPDGQVDEQEAVKGLLSMLH
jgi:hypothetical protein